MTADCRQRQLASADLMRYPSPMRILLIRHGPAGDREAWAKAGKDDDLRPLTPKGRAKMRKAAAGLASILKDIDLIAASPLSRARQTAELLAKRYPKAKALRLDALRPEAGPKTALAWLASLPEDSAPALVGHEPGLGLLAGALLGGGRLELKKGACLLIDAAHPIRPGCGRLLWLLQPKQLRALA